MMQKMKSVRAYCRRMIVLAVLLMAAMAWNTAAPAQYQPNDGWIVVLQFNRCLDADNSGGGGNGTKVQLWDCGPGENQRWVINYDNSVVNAQFATKCLDSDNSGNGGNGTKVQLWDCNGGLNQKWNFTLDGNFANQQFISQCLDADNNNGGNGTVVQIWGCWNGPNQKWWATLQGGTTIHVEASYRCLDADVPTINGNGTIVHLWGCNGGANQIWNMLSDGTIRNLQSHRCLDADTNTIGGNGTKVQLWDCNGGPNQKWRWPGYAFGTGFLGSENINAQSNRCLDADLGTIGENGTIIQLWDCLGGLNQLWLNPGMFPASQF
jgi:Ricin-type beta-trefoil lectin domain/Ricin-type beta-trefoil lectin domain-like